MFRWLVVCAGRFVFCGYLRFFAWWLKPRYLFYSELDRTVDYGREEYVVTPFFSRSQDRAIICLSDITAWCVWIATSKSVCCRGVNIIQRRTLNTTGGRGEVSQSPPPSISVQQSIVRLHRRALSSRIVRPLYCMDTTNKSRITFSSRSKSCRYWWHSPTHKCVYLCIQREVRNTDWRMYPCAWNKRHHPRVLVCGTGINGYRWVLGLVFFSCNYMESDVGSMYIFLFSLVTYLDS